MDFEFLGPMIVGVVGFLTVGGVITLLVRPLSKRLCVLLEAMAQSRGEDLREMRRTLDTTTRHLGLLEERLEFTEELLRAKDRRKSIGEGERP